MEGEDQRSLMSRCDLRAFHPPRFPTRIPRKQPLSTEGLTALLGLWASCHVGFWAPTGEDVLQLRVAGTQLRLRASCPGRALPWPRAPLHAVSQVVTAPRQLLHRS